jgi:hypothetical protein
VVEGVAGYAPQIGGSVGAGDRGAEVIKVGRGMCLSYLHCLHIVGGGWSGVGGVE